MAALYSLTRFLVWLLLLVGGCVLVLRLTVIRWIRLPSAESDPVFAASVEPSLRGGDLILAYRMGQPKFGDLVLCAEPGAPERFIIGRIFGEAGDKVRIVNGEPVVNGKNFVLERSCDPSVVTYPHPDTGAEVKQQCHVEAMAGGFHKVGVVQGHKVFPEDREYNVPEDRWLLLSDNRLFPYDSRDFGYVEATACKERVFARLVGKAGWGDVERRLNYIQ